MTTGICPICKLKFSMEWVGQKEYCGAACYQESRRRLVSARKTYPHEYHIWKTMRQRCLNPRNNDFHDYGARGIKIHESWNDFDTFLRDLGPRPSSLHTIERKKNDGNYEPGNVEWATRLRQSNNRRDTVTITYNGKTQSRADWAREFGIPYFTLRSRMDNYGWTFEEAITKDKWKRVKSRPIAP